MFSRIALLCGALLLLEGVIIAQQKPDKPASTASESSAAPQGPVFDVGSGVTPPKPVFTPDPDYPLSLRKGKHAIQGTCVVALIVDEEGRTRDIHVVRSVDKRLDQNTIEEVKQWKFKPAMKDGKSVAVRTSVEVSFETTLLRAQESFYMPQWPPCVAARPPQEYCVYSDVVLPGVAISFELGRRATLAVGFKSDSFVGVERVTTERGVEFRRAGRPLTEYPDTITVVFKPAMWNSEVKSYHADVKWLDSSHRIIGSKSAELRPVVEIHKSATQYPWPEISLIDPVHAWYEGDLSGIKQSLATDVEIVITEGGGKIPVSTVQGRLFYPVVWPH